MPVNRERVRLLVDALRSGEFEQIADALEARYLDQDGES